MLFAVEIRFENGERCCI